MIGLAVNLATFHNLRKVYEPNQSQTQEQQRTNIFIATIFAALAESFVAVIYIAIAYTVPGSTLKMRSTRAVVTVAAYASTTLMLRDEA